MHNIYIIIYFIIYLGGPKTKVQESNMAKVNMIGSNTNSNKTIKSRKRQSSKQK